MAGAIIAAISKDGIIGVDGDLPWHYPADLKWFKRLTTGGTVIMGRHTWDSLPRKPLPRRRNLVISNRPLDGVESFTSLAEAVDTCRGNIWYIGGAQIFAAAMAYADRIYITYVPDSIDVTAAHQVIYFPPIDEICWQPGPLLPCNDDPRLQHRVFHRRLRKAALVQPKERCSDCGAERQAWQDPDDKWCPHHAMPEPYSSCDGILKREKETP